MLPNFDPKMENQIGTFDINNKAGKASISFTGGFGWWKNNSEMFTNKVDGLLKDGVKDLECYINSPGGSMFEANEIGNQIERFTGTKTANLGAIVASAASKLTTHFDVVNAAENTQWMMHNPRLVAEFTKATDFDSKKQMFENLRNDTISAYKKKSKKSKKQIGDMMDKETWLNAKQCKAEGFVNSIGKKDNNLPKNTLEALNEMQIGSIPDSITNHVQIKNNNMKKVTIALGLPENATEEQIEAAVKALQTTVENAAVNIAVAKGFEPEKAKTLAKNNASAFMEMVNAMPAVANVAPVAAAAADGGTETPATPANEEPASTTADNAALLNKVNAGLEALLTGKGAANQTKKYEDYSEAELGALNEEEFEKVFNEYKTRKDA